MFVPGPRPAATLSALTPDSDSCARCCLYIGKSEDRRKRWSGLRARPIRAAMPMLPSESDCLCVGGSSVLRRCGLSSCAELPAVRTVAPPWLRRLNGLCRPSPKPKGPCTRCAIGCESLSGVGNKSGWNGSVRDEGECAEYTSAEAGDIGPPKNDGGDGGGLYDENIRVPGVPTLKAGRPSGRPLFRRTHHKPSASNNATAMIPPKTAARTSVSFDVEDSPEPFDVEGDVVAADSVVAESEDDASDTQGGEIVGEAVGEGEDVPAGDGTVALLSV